MFMKKYSLKYLFLRVFLIGLISCKILEIKYLSVLYLQYDNLNTSKV